MSSFSDTIKAQNERWEQERGEQLAAAQRPLAELNRRLREHDPATYTGAYLSYRGRIHGSHLWFVLEDPVQSDGKGGWVRASAGQPYVQGRGTTAVEAIADAASGMRERRLAATKGWERCDDDERSSSDEYDEIRRRAREAAHAASKASSGMDMSDEAVWLREHHHRQQLLEFCEHQMARLANAVAERNPGLTPSSVPQERYREAVDAAIAALSRRPS
jgi:hypothetical protein